MAGRLVLAADDSPEILMLLHAVAEVEGYLFVGARSGIECLSLVTRLVPRLILLDIEMPEMSGIETCRRLRLNPALARVPIAFLTARQTVDDVATGMEVGGNDFIVKPFDRARLAERLLHWTSRRV
jgi:CheY-like chemotaxis protein